MWFSPSLDHFKVVYIVNFDEVSKLQNWAKINLLINISFCVGEDGVTGMTHALL